MVLKYLLLINDNIVFPFHIQSKGFCLIPTIFCLLPSRIHPCARLPCAGRVDLEDVTYPNKQRFLLCNSPSEFLEKKSSIALSRLTLEVER